jgi:hypothetical protein
MNEEISPPAPGAAPMCSKKCFRNAAHITIHTSADNAAADKFRKKDTQTCMRFTIATKAAGGGGGGGLNLCNLNGFQFSLKMDAR